MRLVCWLNGWRLYLKTGAYVEGCDYEETAKTRESQTLKCARCGNVSIGYYSGYAEGGG